jgi:DNA modification methylase
VATYSVLEGDALAVLPTLDAESVQTCITSPPYYGLRSYDEDAVCIDPKITDEQREWLVAELERRGVHARC